MNPSRDVFSNYIGSFVTNINADNLVGPNDKFSISQPCHKGSLGTYISRQPRGSLVAKQNN